MNESDAPVRSPPRHDRRARPRENDGSTYDGLNDDRNLGQAGSAQPAHTKPRAAAAATRPSVSNRALAAVWKATGVALKPHTWDSAGASNQRILSVTQALSDDVDTDVEAFDAIFATIPEEVFNGNGNAVEGTEP
eukprot:COSAG02_NODE_15390_length_1175_cov_1.271375_1_plen_134_part_10